MSLQFKFSIHSCIHLLCCSIAFPSHPFAYFLSSGYLLQTPDNSNFFSISQEGSSSRKSTVLLETCTTISFSNKLITSSDNYTLQIHYCTLGAGVFFFPNPWRSTVCPRYFENGPLESFPAVDVCLISRREGR